MDQKRCEKYIDESKYQLINMHYSLVLRKNIGDFGWQWASYEENVEYFKCEKIYGTKLPILK